MTYEPSFLLSAAFATFLPAVASASPAVFDDATGWHQFYAASFGEVAATWNSPLEGAYPNTLLDVAYLGSGTSNNCGSAPAPDYMGGACFGQCVELTDRWFVKNVYRGRPEAQSKIWGNGGDPICQCAAGKNGCATDAALYKVYWPGDKYVPMTGDVLSFSYTHAALVTNLWTDGSGTHLGIAQQNVAAQNVVPWRGDHFDSESCIIHAARLVCEDEPAVPAMAPASGALSFACGDERRTSTTGDWSFGNYKAECGEGQAMTGVSVRPRFASGHAALCGESSSTLLHDTQSCRAVDFSHANVEPAGAPDWDSGYYKGLCNDDEYVAGVSQTPDLRVRAMLCCKGEGMTHQSCATEALAGGDAREQGTSSDWDPKRYKGECGPGRFVAGISATVDGTDKIHAIRCCSGVAAPPLPTTSVTSSSAATTGSGVGGGLPSGGVGGAGGGAGDGATPVDMSLHGSCACREAPGNDASGLVAFALASAFVGAVRLRRRSRR